MLGTSILDHFKLIDYYSDTPYLEIFGGLFLLLLPALIVLMAVRQYVSNQSAQNEITYTFGEGGIKVQGRTFKGEILWAHIIKLKEINRFLVLYHSKRMGTSLTRQS